MRQILFPLIATLIWGVAHAYVARRWWGGALFRNGWTRAARVLLALSALGLPAAMVARALGLDVVGVGALNWVAYVLVGPFVLLFGAVLVRDLALLAFWAARRARRAAIGPRASSGPVLSRRKLLMGASAGVIGAGTLGASVYGYAEARRLARVRRVDVPIEGLDERLDGLTIVQISDVHVGPTITSEYLRAVVETVNELGADVVAITGDLVDGYPDKMAEAIASIGSIEARHGAFFVTGNHEYYWDGPGWEREVARLGVRALRNEHEVVDHDGALLVIAGVTDFSAKRFVPGHASDPSASLAGAPENAFRLLLAHQPKSVWGAAEAGADLQLSGHTHGGQFFPLNFIVGMVHPFVAGLGVWERTSIYVSRGTGYWGPPMRLGAPSEITHLTLRRA